MTDEKDFYPHYIAVRIGRSGSKIHPARAQERIVKNEGKPWESVSYKDFFFACSCPGTQSGQAWNHVQVVADGWSHVNCGNAWSIRTAAPGKGETT